MGTVGKNPKNAFYLSANKTNKFLISLLYPSKQVFFCILSSCSTKHTTGKKSSETIGFLISKGILYLLATSDNSDTASIHV